jgi:hypothetical protein
MLEMLQTMTESNSVVGNPVELKQWDCTKNDYRWFKDMLTRWAANGMNKELPIDKRNALIIEATVSTIELHMIAKLGTVDKTNWRRVNNTVFFKLMPFLFKDGRRDASMAELIPQRLVFKFQLDQGYTSLLPFFTEFHKLQEEYTESKKHFTREVTKQQIDASIQTLSAGPNALKSRRANQQAWKAKVIRGV